VTNNPSGNLNEHRECQNLTPLLYGRYRRRRMDYMIIVGLEYAIYSKILKCERSGQNLIFNNIEEAEKKADEIRKAAGSNVRVVAI